MSDAHGFDNANKVIGGVINHAYHGIVENLVPHLHNTPKSNTLNPAEQDTVDTLLPYLRAKNKLLNPSLRQLKNQRRNMGPSRAGRALSDSLYSDLKKSLEE
jgi:hypothetical protein